jgi:PAS domain-containing protein
MFFEKGKGLAIPVILPLCLVIFSWAFVKVLYLPFVKREILEGGTLFAYLSIIFISILLLLAFYCFVWRRKLTKNDKSLQDLRSKIGFITAHDNVIVMQYDVFSKCFIRWNDKEGTEYRSFSVDDYWSYIHPNDMALAQKLVDFMDSRKDQTYSCEYRYRFPGMDTYSWQSNDIFPYQKDRAGTVISYIGVCKKNNRWHVMQDQLLRIHKDMGQFTSSLGIGFGVYDVVDETFRNIDQDGEFNSYSMSVEQFVSKIHPDDRAHFLKSIASLSELKPIRFHLDYRSSIFKKKQIYNWFACDMIASTYDDHHEITTYLCIFRINDELYKVRESLDHYRQQTLMIAALNGIVFVRYQVAYDFFYHLDAKGEEFNQEIPLNEWFAAIHPDDFPKAMNLMKVLRDHVVEKYHTEYRYRMPNATDYKWYTIDIASFDRDEQNQISSYVCICRDNDEWHKINENLNHFRKRVSYMTTSANIVFLQYDVKSELCYQIDENGSDKILPIEKITSYIFPDDVSKMNELIRRMKEHIEKKFSFEYRIRLSGCESYSWYVTEAVAYAFDEDGQITSYMCLVRDNDAWHKAMEEMGMLNAKAEMMKVLSSFLANIGRKIRTPLNAVIGFSDVITEEESEEARKVYRKIIDENNAMLLKMSDDILTISQLESGSMALSPVTFKISPFLTNLIDDLNDAHPLDVNLVIRTDSQNLTVLFDPSMLNRSITTMLNFVISYATEGDIEIGYQRKDNGLYLTVFNKSFFIDPEDRAHLFDRFENFDRSSKYIPGIGLPVCKAVVSNAKGEIGVDSEQDKGTTCWFWIPCLVDTSKEP